MHRQREHPLAAQEAHGRDRRGLDLVVLDLDPVRAELLSELRARPGRGVRDEPEPVPVSRSRRTASAAPGIGSPETCSTPSTSSRIAAMAAESIRVTRSVVLPRSEIELRTSRSSGPGGQHAQKSETRVEALFDVEASSALSTRRSARVVAKAGPVLRAIAQDERSQLRNKELATERVIESAA